MFAIREPREQLQRLPQLFVTGLATADAHRLLASALAAPVDEQIRAQFIAETTETHSPSSNYPTRSGLNAVENTSDRLDSKGPLGQLSRRIFSAL